MDEDGDATMWDVDREDIDARKREYIKSETFVPLFPLGGLTFSRRPV
jgi:hypothetical protein